MPARRPPELERTVRVRELDPQSRCGPDTSVEELYRVDETQGSDRRVHLVFYDAHGWYCFHGRGCIAVQDVHRELRAQRRPIAADPRPRAQAPVEPPAPRSLPRTTARPAAPPARAARR